MISADAYSYEVARQTFVILLPETGKAVVMAALSLTWFKPDTLREGNLVAQRSHACAVHRLLASGGGLYSLGEPTPLVMTHRRNPDRYVYRADESRQQ